MASTSLAAHFHRSSLAALLEAKENGDEAALLYHNETLGLLHYDADADKAEAYYMEALRLARTSAQTLHVCGRLAALYMAKGPLKHSQAVLDTALRVVAAAPILDSHLPAVFALSIAALQGEQLAAAGKFCQAAVTCAQRASNLSFLRDCYHLLGDINRIAARNNDAIAAYQASSELSLQGENPMHIIRDLNTMGEMLRLDRQFRLAAQTHRRALDHASGNATCSVEMGCCDLVGEVYVQWGNNEEAVAFFLRQVTLAEEVLDTVTAAHAQFKLALTYRKCGSVSLAKEGLLKTLRLATRIASLDLQLRSIAQLGMLALDDSDTARAKTIFLKHLELAARDPDKTRLAPAFEYLGLVAERDRQPDKALNYYAAQLDAASKTEDSFAACCNMARLYGTGNQPDMVVAVFQHYRQLLLPDPHPVKLAEAELQTGRALLLAESDQALLHIAAAEALLEKASKDGTAIAQAKLLHGLAAFRFGRWGTAHTHLQQIHATKGAGLNPADHYAALHVLAAALYSDNKRVVSFQPLAEALHGMELVLRDGDLAHHPAMQALQQTHLRGFTLMALHFSNNRMFREALVLAETKFTSAAHGRLRSRASWNEYLEAQFPTDLLQHLHIYFLAASIGDKFHANALDADDLWSLLYKFYDVHQHHQHPEAMEKAIRELQAFIDNKLCSNDKDAPASLSSIKIHSTLEAQFKRTHAALAQVAQSNGITIVTYGFDPIDPHVVTCSIFTIGGMFESFEIRRSVHVPALVELIRLSLTGNPHVPFPTFEKITSFQAHLQKLKLESITAWLKNESVDNITKLVAATAFLDAPTSTISQSVPDELRASKIICFKCNESFVWNGPLDDEPMDRLLERLGLSAATNPWVHDWLEGNGLWTVRLLKVFWRELHCPLNADGITNLIQSSIRFAPREQHARLIKILNCPFDTYCALRTLYDLLVLPVADLLPPPIQPECAPRVVVVPSGCLKDLAFTSLIDQNGDYLIESYNISTAPSISAVRFSLERMQEIQLAAAGKPRKALLIPDALDWSSAFQSITSSDIALIPAASVTKARVVDELQHCDDPTTVVLALKYQFEAETPPHHQPRVIDELDPPGALVFAQERPNDAQQLQQYLSQMGEAQQQIFLSNRRLSDGDLAGLNCNNIECAVLYLLSNKALRSFDRSWCADGVYKCSFSGLSRALLAAGIPSHVINLWEAEPVYAYAFCELMVRFAAHPARRHVPPADIYREVLLEMLRQPALCNPAGWAAFVHRLG